MKNLLKSFKQLFNPRKIDPKFEQQIQGRGSFEAISKLNVKRVKKKKKTYVGMITLSGLFISGCACDMEESWNRPPLLPMEEMNPILACRQAELRHPGRKYLYTTYGHADGSETHEASWFTDPDSNGVKHTGLEKNEEKPTLIDLQMEADQDSMVANNQDKK